MIKNFLHQLIKIDDPSSFKTEYNDTTVNRERTEEKVSKWDKYNVLNAFAWYPTHYSKYERRYLMKFDSTVLLFLCFSFYTKYLDNSNVGSAYVSGLKQDLNLKGNELNYFNTCYTVGYAAFQIPTTLLITKPMFGRHLLLFCELAWGMMTLANAYVTNASQMYVLRFFIGVFEACSFPVTYVILSSYLTPIELFKRCGFYGAWAVAGTASAGALQSAAMNHLDGVMGLAGWRWQFIIEAVMTFGIFLYGVFTFPGVPTACKEFLFFSEDDMIFARKRVEKYTNVPKGWSLKVLKETLSTWQIYLCSALWVLHHKAWYANTPQLYMRTLPKIYPGTMVTTWDSYINCDGVIFAIIIPPLCAYYGKVIPVNITMLTAYYSAIILVIWEVPRKLLISAFFMQNPYRDGLAQIFFAWFAVLCRDNVEKKAIVLSFAQAASYAVNAFSIPLQFNVKDAPRFHKGYIVNLCLIIGSHIVFFAIWFLEKYDYKYFPKIAGERNTFDIRLEELATSSEEEFEKGEVTLKTVEAESANSSFTN